MEETRDPRQLLKESFPAFLFMVWKELNIVPADPSAVQNDIAEFLQHGPNRKIIMAFRGCGKSYITGAFVLWLLYRDPTLNILVVSASKQRADEFSTFCLNLLERASWLSHMKPRPDQRQSKIAFDVRGAVKASQFPSVRSAGITGQITGSRADYIIADDIEIPNNSDTEAAREKLEQQVTDFENILKPVPHASIIYLGTPQTEQSIYNKLGEKKYVVRIWPSRFPGETDKYGSKLSPWVARTQTDNPDLVGHSVWPERFSDENLRARELAQGKSNHALQFQLDTSLSDLDKFPLKLSDLIVMDLNPTKGPTEVIWASGDDQRLELPAVGLPGDRYYGPMVTPQDFTEYSGCVMFIDPSGRGKDETAWAVVAHLHGNLFLLDSGGAKGGYDDQLLKQLLQIAKRYSVRSILVEPNFGDGMFARLLASHRQANYNVLIEDAKWSRSSKEARIIDTLEPVLNQHRLVVDKQLITRDYQSTAGYPLEEQNSYRLMYQLTRVYREKDALRHDDRLDALAGAVAHFVEAEAQDQKRSIDAYKQAMLDKELKTWFSDKRTSQPSRIPTLSRHVRKSIRSIR